MLLVHLGIATFELRAGLYYDAFLMISLRFLVVIAWEELVA